MVTHDTSPRIKYAVKELEAGSAKVVLEAQRINGQDVRKETLRHFRGTLSGLQNGRLDTRLDSQSLGQYRDLGSIAVNGSVTIGRLAISKAMYDSATVLAEKTFSSKGSVKGVLGSVTVHGRQVFYLYPPAGPNKVRCVFRKSILKDVRDALGEVVTVFGECKYRGLSVHPCLVTVGKICEPSSDDSLSTLHDVKTAGNWDTGSLSALEYVRLVRNG